MRLVTFSLKNVRARIIENSTTPILFRAKTKELLNVRSFNAFIRKYSEPKLNIPSNIPVIEPWAATSLSCFFVK